MTPLPPERALDWRKRVRIDRYATVLAHVVHYGSELFPEVLRRFGLQAADWQAIDEAWTAELTEVVRRQQGDLAMRFSSTFARVRRELAQKQPALASVGEPILPAPPPPSPPEPPSPRERPLLSYELAQRSQLLPLQASPPPPERMMPPQPASGPTANVETGDIDLQAIRRGLNLPFLPKPADEAPDDMLRRFPLARYAEITVSLGRGDDKPTIFARHELTEATWSTLATTWSQRLQRDPQLLAQFHAYVKELRGQR